MIGAFVIGVLGDGLVMVGVSSFWQKVIKGLVIVLAVIIDQIQARMQERIALQKQQELGSDRSKASLLNSREIKGVERHRTYCPSPPSLFNIYTQRSQKYP